MRFECPGCDTILTRDAALNHTKHGGICNTMYPIRHDTKSANDHDIEEEVDKLQNKEKKVDDIANSNEEEIKKQKEKDETKKANMKLSKEELDEILESLRAEIEELKDPKDKETKEASTIKSEFIGLSNSDINTSRNSEYSVLTLGPYQDNSLSGDSLLIKLGSTDHNSKGYSRGDNLLISLGSSE